MTLTKPERETILRFSEDAEEGLTVYTHSKRLRDRMKRLGATLVRVSKHRDREVAWTFRAERDWFRAPSKPRKASQAQREALQNARRISSTLASGAQDETK